MRASWNAPPNGGGFRGSARRLYEEGAGVNQRFGLAVVKDRDKVGVFEQRSSLYRLLDGRTRRHGSGLRVRNSRRAVRPPDDERRLPELVFRAVL
jgi:hypothetical protein